MAYWLMKSEPDTFSIDDLAKRPKQIEAWDGVRNYQARNFMRRMQLGDQMFFYHSSCAIPGIVGLMKLKADAHPDPSQFDSKNQYYDAASKPEEPRWSLVDVQFDRKLKRIISLDELRTHEAKLSGFPLLVRGSRLSVMPVRAEHWDYILKLEKKPPPDA